MAKKNTSGESPEETKTEAPKTTAAEKTETATEETKTEETKSGLKKKQVFEPMMGGFRTVWEKE